jgi:hypothetical protein
MKARMEPAISPSHILAAAILLLAGGAVLAAQKQPAPQVQSQSTTRQQQLQKIVTFGQGRRIPSRRPPTPGAAKFTAVATNVKRSLAPGVLDEPATITLGPDKIIDRSVSAWLSFDGIRVFDPNMLLLALEDGGDLEITWKLPRNDQSYLVDVWMQYWDTPGCTYTVEGEDEETSESFPCNAGSPDAGTHLLFAYRSSSPISVRPSGGVIVKVHGSYAQFKQVQITPVK